MSQERDIDEGEELEIIESELEEGIDKIENWRKCSRPCSGHEGPTGAKCVQEPLENEAELKEYYKELKEKLKGKKKRNKTSGRDQRPTGNAPGGSTAPTKVSSGAGGQVSSESGL